MEPTILPLQQPNINFSLLLRTGRMALKRSLSRVLDRDNFPSDTPAAFICMLSSLEEDSNILPQAILKNAGDLLVHLHYSFIVIAESETFIEVIRKSPLHVAMGETVQSNIIMGVLSANMEEWRTGIINLTTGRESTEARQLMNKTLDYFAQLKLSPVWSDYIRHPHPDGTILLLERKD